MIKIIDKSKCSGCSACAGICPRNSISMKTDGEGFVYPNVNQDTCIDCGACDKICPIINAVPENKTNQWGFIIQNKDLQVLRESTAGGFYTAIAEYVIEKNGIVYGAEISNTLEVHHISIVCSGRLVLFSGTPCQIEGLIKIVGNHKNLLTVDVVCRATPSPLMFRKYIEYQEKIQNSRIKQVIFRDKFYGYKYSTLNLTTENNNGNYHCGVESDPWLRAFFSNKINRPACYECHFRKQYRISDFTIWDCFQVGRYSKKLDNDKGATRLLIHSEQGYHIFDQIKFKFNYISVSPDKLVKTTKEMFCSIEKPNYGKTNIQERSPYCRGSSKGC